MAQYIKKDVCIFHDIRICSTALMSYSFFFFRCPWRAKQEVARDHLRLEKDEDVI